MAVVVLVVDQDRLARDRPAVRSCGWSATSESNRYQARRRPPRPATAPPPPARQVVAQVGTSAVRNPSRAHATAALAEFPPAATVVGDIARQLRPERQDQAPDVGSVLHLHWELRRPARGRGRLRRRPRRRCRTAAVAFVGRDMVLAVAMTHCRALVEPGQGRSTRRDQRRHPGDTEQVDASQQMLRSLVASCDCEVHTDVTWVADSPPEAWRDSGNGSGGHPVSTGCPLPDGAEGGGTRGPAARTVG